jgi:DNA-binding NtrC family response regulator
MRTVLVIDDNPAVITALKQLLGFHEIRTLAAETPEQGLATLDRGQPDLVIADMNFRADTTSGEEGVELFRAIRARYPDLPVILLTGWTHLPSAVQLVKAGAADYIAKPWDNEKLLATVENLLELAESNRERVRLLSARRQRREQLAARYDLRDTIFESEAMEAAVELACRVARATVPVLITGPSGAGKERIASILHANSEVAKGPFVTLNCGAIPPDLLEAELFGAEAGAFTGAKARTGRFELANDGTLFLDEIGNLALGGQMKLLRVLETGQYEPLGSSRTRTARVRLLSATNADLPASIREGQFREDLYYRLNVIEIRVPPLAERAQDILPLAAHFLGGTLQLSDDAREALLSHPWPGNVRELRNCIERAKLLAREGTISAVDLSLPALRSGGAPMDSARREEGTLSREVIEASLRAAGGNVSQAAESLGLSRQAFYRRLERYGLRS